MRFFPDKLIALTLAGVLVMLPAGCVGTGRSTMGRSAATLAQESRTQQYAIGPQFENQLSEMISQEVVALGVKESVPMEFNREVLLNINYFLNDARNFMTTGLSRGSKYIPMMKGIFRQKGLPEDLVYLALIESGFKTSAVSHASAVGPWQFIASTGRNYGLTINDWVDERMDPVKSTYAAADYLTALHDMFNSWPLAIAAYNSGEGKIMKGMKNYGVSNFWDMSNVRDHLAAETRLYVPSFLAATFIAKDPAAYGLQINIQEPDQWDEVVVPAPIDLKKVADFSGSTLERVKELNPHLKKDTTPPDESDFVLRIPSGSSKRFAKAYGNYAKDSEAVAQTIAMAKSSLGKPTLSTITHKVKSGDNLGSIAKRYGVTVASIQKSNNIKDTKLKVGQVLKIQSDLPLTAQKKSESSQLMVVTTPAKPRTSATHTVAAGESLSVIARKYNMSVKELADTNQLQGSTIKVGQKLKVSGPPAVEKSGETPKPAAANIKAGATHTVAAGETIGHIAQQYGIGSKDLMALNDMSGPNIRIGQKLKVPAKSGGSPTQAKTESPSRPSSTPSPAGGGAPGTHTVASGETIGHIAQKYGLSSKDLMALNGMTGPNIRIGQKLKVPAGKGGNPAQSKAKTESPKASGANNSGVGQSAPPQKSAPPKTPVPAASNSVTHTVSSGENVGTIAKKYGLSPQELMSLNGMDNPVIRVGQKLKVGK